VEERSKELDHLAQSLSANALDRLQRGLESSREEGVDRIVSRLKEQSAPVIDHAKETIAGLVQQREELEKVLDQALSKATGKIEEVCSGFEKQFEMIVRERLDAAREELQKTIQAAMSASLDRFNSSAQRQEAETQARLQTALGPIETALGDIQQKAAETTRQFSLELENQSRAHLELVGTAISDVAKGIGKLPKQ
jgi:dsDNA-specific endonuclease/ATPase MutS2